MNGTMTIGLPATHLAPAPQTEPRERVNPIADAWRPRAERIRRRVRPVGVFRLGVALVLLGGASARAGFCPEDLNEDSCVDLEDLRIVDENMGLSCFDPSCDGDIDGDGEVTPFDRLLAINAWGQCGGGPCPFPTGACVINGDCVDLAYGGTYQGDGTEALCQVPHNPCATPGEGACCYAWGCTPDTEAVCLSNGGYRLVMRATTDLLAPICPDPLGACCAPTGTCHCGPSTEAACLAAGGVYFGDASTCEPGLCKGDRLDGDIDLNGAVNEVDVQLFVLALLDSPEQSEHKARADLDCDGKRNGLDIAPMISAVVGP